MKLPNMVYSDGIKNGAQTEFAGLNHSLGAKDGEIWDMRNMTSDHYPVMASRAPRLLYKTLEAGGGLYSWEKLCWVDGTGFYYDGELKGGVSEGQKVFSALGVYIIILPDKAYLNTDNGEFGSLESIWSGNTLTFTNGKLFDEGAEANTIQADGVDWNDYFRAGDAVTISGATKFPENNKTSVIREIDGDKLYFYEYIFRLDGDGTSPYDETGELSISRTVPELLYICENENRLWGCDRTTIYSSKLGDIFNWNVYEGLDTDSYAVDTGSAGIFTGCVSFLGYPVFFKEENIYKVYGSLPSNFEIMSSATLGVAEGSSASLAIAGEMLFYLSRAGVMGYSGGIPQPIGAAFGMMRHRNAKAGSDGLKYYISMQDESGTFLLHVYDTQRGLWHTEDETHAKYFARQGGNLYFLNDFDEIWITGNITDPPDVIEVEDQVEWEVEFADFTEGNLEKKGMSKLQIRLELDEYAIIEAHLQFDSDGIWHHVGRVTTKRLKRSYYLPIIPRRADHYRLLLRGTGGCRVYAIDRESYTGSKLKSLPGRQ